MKSKAAMTFPSLYGRSLVAVFLLVAIGCSSVARMYPGPAMPSDKIATLSFYDPIEITSVDGERVPISGGVLELLPGSHTISVDYVICNYRSGECEHADKEISLTFDARAGGSYKMGYSRKGNAWNAWVIEKEGSKDTPRN